jgi:hypothetical protein
MHAVIQKIRVQIGIGVLKNVIVGEGGLRDLTGDKY